MVRAHVGIEDSRYLALQRPCGFYCSRTAGGEVFWDMYQTTSFTPHQNNTSVIRSVLFVAVTAVSIVSFQACLKGLGERIASFYHVACGEMSASDPEPDMEPKVLSTIDHLVRDTRGFCGCQELVREVQEKVICHREKHVGRCGQVVWNVVS